MMDKIRVLRVIEYVGDRDWVEKTILRSIHGTVKVPQVQITAATIGTFPEILAQGENEPHEVAKAERRFDDEIPRKP